MDDIICTANFIKIDFVTVLESKSKFKSSLLSES